MESLKVSYMLSSFTLHLSCQLLKWFIGAFLEAIKSKYLSNSQPRADLKKEERTDLLLKCQSDAPHRR